MKLPTNYSLRNDMYIHLNVCNQGTNNKQFLFSSIEIHEIL